MKKFQLAAIAMIFCGLSATAFAGDEYHDKLDGDITRIVRALESMNPAEYGINQKEHTKVMRICLRDIDSNQFRLDYNNAPKDAIYSLLDRATAGFSKIKKNKKSNSFDELRKDQLVDIYFDVMYFAIDEETQEFYAKLKSRADEESSLFSENSVEEGLAADIVDVVESEGSTEFVNVPEKPQP